MVVFQFCTFLVAEPYAADEIFCQSHKGQVVPVLCSTRLTGNMLVFQLCLLTSTIVDNILQQLVHDIRSFAADSFFRTAVIFINEVAGTLYHLADKVSLILCTAVAIGNIAIDQIFQCNTICQRTNCQRRVCHIGVSVAGIFTQIQTHFGGGKVENALRCQSLTKLSRYSVVGFFQCLIYLQFLVADRHGRTVLAVVGRPCLALNFDRLVLVNRAPVNQVAFQSQSVGSQRLNGRTGLPLFHGGVVEAQGFCLFPDCTDHCLNLALIVHCNKSRLRINDFTGGVFAVAVLILPLGNAVFFHQIV